MKSDLVDLDVEKVHATAKAVLVTTGSPEEAVWLPRSAIEIVPKEGFPGLYVVTLPERLAIEKGLV